MGNMAPSGKSIRTCGWEKPGPRFAAKQGSKMLTLKVRVLVGSYLLLIIAALGAGLINSVAGEDVFLLFRAGLHRSSVGRRQCFQYDCARSGDLAAPGPP
jgi:hypothetical protein